MSKSKLILLSLLGFALLSGCTRVYVHDFAIEPVDSFSSPRELYTSVREYFSGRGFPVERDTVNRVSFQLATNQGKILPTAPSDYLTLTLDDSNRVSFELVRISSGGDFSKQQLGLVKETLEKRILERTGKKIRVTLLGSRPGL